MSTSELQGLKLPVIMNIDGIQAHMDHTNPLAKFVQWLSFLFAGNWVRLSLFIYHIPSVPWYDLTVSLYFTISSPWLLSWPPWHLLQQPGTQVDFNNQNPQSPIVDFEQLRTLFEEWRVRVVPGFSVLKTKIATWPLVTANIHNEALPTNLWAMRWCNS